MLPAPPAAGGGSDAERIYVPLQDGRLAALSRDRGAIVWSRELESRWPPRIDRSSLFVTGVGAMHALDPATGETRWQAALPAESAGPLSLAGDRLIVSLENGALHSVTADGATAWTADLGASSRVRVAASSPCGVVYAALDDGRVAAVSCDDGRVLWTRTIGGTLTAPAVVAARVLVGSSTDQLYALNAASGRLDWVLRTGNDVAGIAADDERIYVVALDNIVRALDRDSGNLRWQQVMETRPLAGPALFGGRVFVPGIRPSLASYDARTGAPGEPVTLPPPYERAVLAGSPLLLPEHPEPAVTVAAITRGGAVIGLRARTVTPSLEEPAVSDTGD